MNRDTLHDTVCACLFTLQHGTSDILQSAKLKTPRVAHKKGTWH